MVVTVRKYENDKLVDKSFFTGEYDSLGFPITNDYKSEAKVYSDSEVDEVVKQVIQKLAKVKIENISYLVLAER